MSQREIRVDPDRLAVLAASLRLAHTTLAASPRYAHLEAGDVRGRLPGAVRDFITGNSSPREELVQQLDMAGQLIGAAQQAFAETESCLVRALTGGGSS